MYLRVHIKMEWLVPELPYLIEDTAKAPDITGSGVLAVVQGLRGCPLYRDLPATGLVEVFVLQVSGQPKISNLEIVKVEMKEAVVGIVIVTMYMHVG